LFNNKHTVLEDGIRYEKRNGLSTKTEEAPGQERIGPGSTLSLLGADCGNVHHRGGSAGLPARGCPTRGRGIEVHSIRREQIRVAMDNPDHPDHDPHRDRTSRYVPLRSRTRCCLIFAGQAPVFRKPFASGAAGSSR
jgi:hypothetical protein